MSHHSLAREFNRNEISEVIPVNGKPPETEPFHRRLLSLLRIVGQLRHARCLSCSGTFLAYGMNGLEIPAPHGAPLRLRVARQLGYKSVKYLSHIAVTDTLKNIGKGLGSLSPEEGYSWYAGI
jgi:DMSO/TMAO reductase YedYZ molybdopterin-dependent catalytic subunit